MHRHGVDSENAAYAVEAALIDAYPGLTNQALGHGSGDYGCRHVEEIIQQYEAEPFEVGEPLVLISMHATFEQGRSIYDAVRYAWKVNLAKVTERRLVLANNRGTVVGAFRPSRWLEATRENFPQWNPIEGRYGFEGEEAEESILKKYVGKLVPEQYRLQGAANPIKYCDA